MVSTQHTPLFFFLTCVACVGLVWRLPVEAAITTGMPVGAATLTLTLDPVYPGPGDTVRVRVRTSAVELRSSQVTWTLNGSVRQQSIGGDTFTFTAGKVGDTLVIEATARSSEGRTLTGSEVVHVGDVALAWEARTYTPPFFRGRALQGPNADVVLLALPTVTDPKGVLYDPRKLTYEWYFNDEDTPSRVGVGLASVLFHNAYGFDDLAVIVRVKDPTGTPRALTHITVPLTQSEVRLYVDDPLKGTLYANALGDTYTLTAHDVTLTAEPYYFSAETRDDPVLTYTWSVGGAPTDARGRLTLAPQGTGVGSAPVSLGVQHGRIVEQGAEQSTIVSFNTLTDTAGATTPL